jgi:hypothetical protein
VSLIWLQPAAWVGVVVVGVPVLIHLLVRQQSRRLLFPSLRFLRTTAVASWRRQVVSDWPLLIVRTLILAAAVAALASPVFISDARRDQWGQRIARAIVVARGGDGSTATAVQATDELIGRERASSAFTATFTARGAVADAVRDAVAWLQRQPPSRRELVIAGNLRRGTVTSGDLSLVPVSVGIRFEPASIATSSSVVEMTAVADNGDGGTRSYDLSVTPTDRATEVTYRRVPGSADWLAVQAPPAEQRAAAAARAATLAEGLVNDRPKERRVTIAFPGEGMLRAADLSKPPASSWMHDAAGRLDGLIAGERQSQFVVLSDVQASDSSAVDLVARVARAAVTASGAALEPLPVPAERLAAWSRPPGPADEHVAPRDEGDRRWLWTAALALLAIEQVLRRSRRAQQPSAAIATDREARVA